jgi:hypothetical protein
VNSATPIRDKDKLNKPTAVQVTTAIQATSQCLRDYAGNQLGLDKENHPTPGKSSLLELTEQRFLVQLK